MGTLMAKAAAKARNSHNWTLAGMPPPVPAWAINSGTEKVPW
jgi:hypothetical protein